MAVPQVSVESSVSERLGQLVQEAIAVTKAAKRHKKGLRGDNFYADKFAALRAEATNAFRDMAPTTAGDSSAIAELLDTVFSATAAAGERRTAAQELRHNLRTTWRSPASARQKKPEITPMVGSKVFIVHGHNGEAKESVARFVEKLGLEAVILHERPNKGRTIITKFQEESQGAAFAVVLMTPDDEGRAVNAANLRSRARQNVVFELGFFIGKLGADRVAAMVKGDVERPSDFDGVVYISLDGADWRVKLASELRAAGLSGDWTKVLD
jgi:predicted nucleotide-binding protein